MHIQHVQKQVLKSRSYLEGCFIFDMEFLFQAWLVTRASAFTVQSLEDFHNFLILLLTFLCCMSPHTFTAEECVCVY